MDDAMCDPLFHSSDLNLWPFDLKIAVFVTPYVSNLYYKFECCTVFRFRVNGEQTDGWRMGVTRNAAF